MSAKDHLRRMLDRALGGALERKDKRMDRRLESRVEAIERRLNELAGIELCDACGGPIPYSYRLILAAHRHSDGHVEYMYDRCSECHQPVNADGRGLGEPSQVEGFALQMLWSDDYGDGKTPMCEETDSGPDVTARAAT